VGEEPVDGIDTLHRLLGGVPPGTELDLTVVRRARRLTVALTAREPP